MEQNKGKGVLFATFDKHLAIALNSRLMRSTTPDARGIFISNFGEAGQEIYQRYCEIIANMRPIVLQAPWLIAYELCKQLKVMLA